MQAHEDDPTGLLLRCQDHGGRSLYVFSGRADEEARRSASIALGRDGFAVVDHLLGAETAMMLRKQSLALYHKEQRSFESGAVGGGYDGQGTHHLSAAIRGDRMRILKDDSTKLALLPTLTEELDVLVQQLAHLGGDACAELHGVDHRSSPMLAIYPGEGARYMRHVDNPDGNGRLLTALYYLNAAWAPGDGGELRVWTCNREDATEERSTTLSPLLDRCIVFWSDRRVPHEVLASHRERIALSVWFHTTEDAARVEPATALRAVAAAAAATLDDQAALRRAKLLAEGDESEQRHQRMAEETYAKALRTAAATLRTSGHVSIRAASDQALLSALRNLAPLLHGAPSGTLRWVDAPSVEGKLKILLHQLLPSRGLAAGCTRLLLARSSGGDVRWLSKPKGAKALMLTRLEASREAPRAEANADDDDDDDDDDGCASVHSRLRRLTDNGTPPPGWPKTSGAFVLLTPPPGTLHAFDCGLPPLHVRLCDVDVAGIFTFGSEGEDQPALVREREVAATLTPDPP